MYGDGIRLTVGSFLHASTLARAVMVVFSEEPVEVALHLDDVSPEAGANLDAEVFVE